MKYLRQEALKEIAKSGQRKISKTKIAIIGLGALGTVSAELLTRAGIGELLLVDKDVVTIENLHRQFLYKEKHVNKPKVKIAKLELNKINIDVLIKSTELFLNDDNTNILDDYDFILDCTDNMRTRLIIDRYCKNKKKTWIHAAATGIRGNVLVVPPSLDFSKFIRSGENFDNCNEIGVINTLTVMISSMQVTQTIKLILNKNIKKELIRINVWENTHELFKIK